jgi:hypothetical protein
LVSTLKKISNTRKEISSQMGMQIDKILGGNHPGVDMTAMAGACSGMRSENEKRRPGIYRMRK